MQKWVMKNKILTLMLAEVVLFLLYTAYAVAAYADREIVFSDNDSQVMNTDGSVSPGTYLDTSYESAKAVVTPAFSLDKGIYDIEAEYRGSGIMLAGLIYDPTRNGKESVNDNEITLNPQENLFSYRVNIKNDSSVRFKIRLTGDAVEGDYVQLLNVRVASSKLTYVYFISKCVLLLVAADLLLLVYFRCYRALSPEQKMIGIILTVIAFITVLPLYQPGLSGSADLEFHLQRIEGIYRGLLSGQFPVRIQPGWLDGNGYAVSVFYGDIFMYFPAILRMVGFTVQEVYKIYAGAINIATVFVSFYAFRKMAKDDIAAMAGTVLYACGGSRVLHLFEGMVGMYSGMLFYPLVIAGFYLIFTEDPKDKAYKNLWMLLSVGFSGLLMSHMLSCLMVGAFSALACLMMAKRVFRRETLTELCKAVLMAVLLNLWYLIPFLQYMLTEQMRINSNLTAEAANYDYHVLLADFVQSGESLYSLFTDQNTIGYGFLLLLLLYVITIPIQRKTGNTKQIRVVFLYTIFVLWICTEYFPCVKLAECSTIIYRYFRTLQYQNRFLSVFVALAASLSALFIASDILKKELLYLFAGLLCCISIYQNLQYSATEITDKVYLDGVDIYSHSDNSFYEYGIGNAEYLPVAADLERITKDIEADEMLQIIDHNRKDLKFDTTVINNANQPQVIVYPALYYGGYRAVDVENGIELETAASDYGCVEVAVPSGYSGTIHMAFREPWYWRAAECISLLTLGVILYVYYTSKCQRISICVKNYRRSTKQNGD